MKKYRHRHKHEKDSFCGKTFGLEKQETEGQHARALLKKYPKQHRRDNKWEMAVRGHF